jgi:GNAT superfamily N-acetyltransferase
MISIRFADLADRAPVSAFYRETGYEGRVRADDRLVLAERDGELVGVYRLAREHGVLVLRGMRVHASVQRQGVGARLLVPLLDLDECCYCVAHAHLDSFYGRAGFEPLADESTPAFLSERLASYRARRLDVRVLRRLPGRAIAVASEADLAPFLDLLESAATWLWDRGIQQWPPGSMRAQEPLLLRAARAGELVIARDAAARAGELVIARDAAALAGGCVLTADPTPEWDGHAGDALYVHKLVVARSQAGSGLAQRILDWCARRAGERGVSGLRLDCWDGNARLRALYRDAGFRELEAVPSLGYEVRLFERPLDRGRREVP